MYYTMDELQKKIKSEALLDIDWYCVDTFGHIAIVASGAGMLPGSVVDSYASNELINYFRSLANISDEIILQQSLKSKVKSMNTIERDNYLRDISMMVSKGLYYFDKMHLQNYFDFEYYLKAKPNVALTLEKVDYRIRDIINRTVININFENDNIFYVNEIR